MNIARPAILLCLLAVLLPGVDVGATVHGAGCPTRAGFTYNPNALLLIDGYVVGEMGSGTPGDARFNAIPSAEILSISIVCNFYPEAGSMRHAVAVVTKTGVETMLTSFLKDLVREQEAYRTAHGGYTTSLAALRFFETRMLLPLTISDNEGGWSALATYAAGNMACEVAVGSAAAGAGRESGVVACRSTQAT